MNTIDIVIFSCDYSRLPEPLIESVINFNPELNPKGFDWGMIHLHDDIKILAGLLDEAKKYNGIFLKYADSGHHYQRVSVSYAKNNEWYPIAEWEDLSIESD